MSSRGIKEVEKYLRQLDIELEKYYEKVDQLDPRLESKSYQLALCEECAQVLTKVHDAYVHMMKFHLFRGMCAADRIQGQRYFESGHSCREKYDRLRLSENYQKLNVFIQQTQKYVPKNPSQNNDLLDERILWKNEYLRVFGDISFHLAYTYMRSGKVKYAIEEARLATKTYSQMCGLTTYELVPRDDISVYNSKIDRDKQIRLRHAWGLVAVITCNMGTSPEIQEECNLAITMIKGLQIGPVQDSSIELERLQKILEFNKSRNSKASSQPDSPSQRLAENWKTTVEKCDKETKERDQRLFEMIKRESELFEANQERYIDYNLLLSYFFLTAITAFLCYAFVAILPGPIRHKH